MGSCRDHRNQEILFLQTEYSFSLNEEILTKVSHNIELKIDKTSDGTILHRKFYLQFLFFNLILISKKMLALVEIKHQTFQQE